MHASELHIQQSSRAGIVVCERKRASAIGGTARGVLHVVVTLCTQKSSTYLRQEPNISMSNTWQLEK